MAASGQGMNPLTKTNAEAAGFDASCFASRLPCLARFLAPTALVSYFVGLGQSSKLVGTQLSSLCTRLRAAPPVADPQGRLTVVAPSRVQIPWTQHCLAKGDEPPDQDKCGGGGI